VPSIYTEIKCFTYIKSRYQFSCKLAGFPLRNWRGFRYGRPSPWGMAAGGPLLAAKHATRVTAIPLQPQKLTVRSGAWLGLTFIE
jgi:hypothetical protein